MQKYQVFVSSTYTDLKDERDQVIKAILEMGHIPVGMEMFSAADEAQWKIITRQIDQSDYYIVIIAHRYGSLVKGISYTEKEYDYAVKQGIPVLGFILDEKVPWPPEFIDDELKAKSSLKKFIAKVKRKPVNFWSSKEQLYAQISIALSKAFNTNPRPGWVRTSDVAGPEVLTELSRLSRENADLRRQLEEVGKYIDITNLSQGEDLLEIPYHFYGNTEKTEKQVLAQGLFSISWQAVFIITGRKCLSDTEEYYIHQALDYSIRTDIIHNRPEVARNSNLKLGAYFERVKIQLMALNLIDVETMVGGGNSAVLHWILTPYGKRKLLSLLADYRETENSNTDSISQ